MFIVFCAFPHSNKRIARENGGVLTAVVDEEIERYMLVPLFHIPLFCISFIVWICVHLVYCM
jgi:hypothetical protein